MSSIGSDNALKEESSIENELQVYRSEFRGSATEFFRIWIVNVVLTILTLGVYSAWAKVRTRRYFYGNTFVAESNFDFHADPISILKGRSILVIVAVFYVGLIKLFPAAVILVWLVFAALFPWVYVKAVSFNLANSSYRNLRFGFDPLIKDAYVLMFENWLLVFFTFGFGYPVLLYRYNQFTIRHMRYGAKRFEFSSRWEDFYTIAIVGFGAGAAVVVVGGILAVGLIFLGKLAGESGKFVGSLGIGVIFAFAYAGILIAGAYVRAKTPNLIASASRLGPIRFRSELKGREVIWIYITNALAIAFSFGFMVPWAMVRMVRYRTSRTMLLANRSELDQLVQGETNRLGAVADAAADFGDFDLGF